MEFRPCIDLHQGIVKQIVGSTLTDSSTASPITNFESALTSVEFAQMYAKDQLKGGHVIMLGANEKNQKAALEALRAYPQGLQVGGGITAENAALYIDAGASHVIVTSYVFRDGQIDFDRLKLLNQTIGKSRIVLDLSCRKKPKDESNNYYVVTDRWQKFTDVCVSKQTLQELAEYCDEFLVHAVDVEGKRCGIQQDLVVLLAEGSPIPVTYAGGAKSLEDLDLVKELGSSRVHLSIGSALDIFGGEVSYADVVAWQKKNLSG